MNDLQRQQINNCLVSLAKGDVAALDALACIVSGRMLSVALSVVKNRTLAEDVVQDSFVKIVQNASRYKRNTNGYAWICKLVQNTALNAMRTERRFNAENIDCFFSIADSQNVAEQSTAAVAVNKAMAVLEKREQALIYQKYFMDFTVRDSAKALGISKSAAQRMIVAAEEKMKHYLGNGTKG